MARGGNQRDLTVGHNWYLNPNTRMMMNYIYADVESPLNGVDGFSQADSASSRCGSRSTSDRRAASALFEAAPAHVNAGAAFVVRATGRRPLTPY